MHKNDILKNWNVLCCHLQFNSVIRKIIGALRPPVQFSYVQLLSHFWLLRPHGIQYTRLPCPPATPGVYSNSCSLSPCHPSHPVLSSSPPAFNISQHQSLFQWVCSSHQVAKVLEFQFQHQFFQWIFRTDFL